MHQQPPLSNATVSPELEYRVFLVQERIRAIEQDILASSLADGSQEAINSYALAQMEAKGGLLEARYILQLLLQPIPNK